MNSTDDFQNIIKEIHRANKGWHVFEVANRFLGLSDPRFRAVESHYLKRKNMLQEELEAKYPFNIEIKTDVEIGNPIILIKEEHIFIEGGKKFDSACHKKKEL